jgi:Stress responsive A/B Barrel Domain
MIEYNMVTHVVLLQPKPETTAEELAAAFEHVRALQQVIPGIVAISVGGNLSAYHGGFTHGIIMHFVDEAHLNAHHPHPAHQAVVEELDRLCQQTIDFDLPENEI